MPKFTVFSLLWICFVTPALWATTPPVSTDQSNPGTRFHLEQSADSWRLSLWKDQEPLWLGPWLTNQKTQAIQLTENLSIALAENWISVGQDDYLNQRLSDPQGNVVFLNELVAKTFISSLEFFLQRGKETSVFFKDIQSRRTRVQFLSRRLNQCTRLPSSDLEVTQHLRYGDTQSLFEYYQRQEAHLATQLADCKNI